MKAVSLRKSETITRERHHLALILKTRPSQARALTVEWFFRCLQTAPSGQNGSLVYLEKNPGCLRQAAGEELARHKNTDVCDGSREERWERRGEPAGVFVIRALMLLMSDRLQECPV